MNVKGEQAELEKEVVQSLNNKSGQNSNTRRTNCD